MSFLRSCFVSVVVDESGSAKRAVTFGMSMSSCVVLMFPIQQETA